jgi:hypothetical protein
VLNGNLFQFNTEYTLKFPHITFILADHVENEVVKTLLFAKPETPRPMSIKYFTF